MVNPTNELRDKLGELGVECGLDASSTHRSLWWRVGGVSYSATEVAGKVKVTAYYLTPEQAIAATVGAGTCHIIEDEDTGYLTCSECGAIQPDDYTVYHCWCCGKKIKED